MKKVNYFLISLITIFALSNALAQEELHHKVFKNEPINFGGITGNDSTVSRFQSGRIIYKKVTVPTFPQGTDVSINLTLRSNGDRWDKSGSCFVVTRPDQISIIDVAKGEKTFPKSAALVEKYNGVLAADNYSPVVEILRFMTPFGVGFYSNQEGKHRKPVYIPSWDKEVVWHQDLSDLISIISGTFYVGIWVDSWTAEGYEVDLSFTYSNRPKIATQVLPLVNNLPYVGGQPLPVFFAETPLDHTFKLKKGIKKAKLHYITTGHGGHSGGDEFIKIRNSVIFDNNLVLDTIPWRNDCASFRRFNPTSGVWLRKDSASYIDFESHTYKVKEIEERIASSDLSRSNWCPGSSVLPYVIDLGDLKAGSHTLSIKIPATAAYDDKLNHWLVSAYLTYEE